MTNNWLLHDTDAYNSENKVQLSNVESDWIFKQNKTLKIYLFVKHCRFIDGVLTAVNWFLLF